MKSTIDDLDATFASCKRTGKLREKSVDVELVRSLVLVAEQSVAFIERSSHGLRPESADWTFVFRDHYEALRMLIEAYALLDGLEAETHQCKNAWLCFEHPELEVDWAFLETIRLKRNAINYRGQLLRADDWRRFKPNFVLHLDILKRRIAERLGERNVYKP